MQNINKFLIIIWILCGAGLTNQSLRAAAEEEGKLSAEEYAAVRQDQQEAARAEREAQRLQLQEQEAAAQAGAEEERKETESERKTREQQVGSVRGASKEIGEESLAGAYLKTVGKRREKQSVEEELLLKALREMAYSYLLPQQWQSFAGESRDLETGLDIIQFLVVSSDGRYLVAADRSTNGTVKVWSTSHWDAKPRILECGAQIMSVVFSPNGRYLAVRLIDFSNNNQSIKIWDMFDLDAEPKVVLADDQPISTTLFSPNGKYFVAELGYYSSIKIWDTANWEAGNWDAEPRALMIYGTISQTLFSPDSTCLAVSASAAAFPLDNVTVTIWDTARWSAEPRVLDGGNMDDTFVIGFSSDNRYFVLSVDDNLKIWDRSSWDGEPRVLAGGARIGALIFSPNGRYLVAELLDKSTKVWDTHAWTKEPIVLGNEYVDRFMFSADGRYLIARCFNRTVIKIWDTDNWEADEPAVVSGGSDIVCSPDGKYLVAVLGRGIIRIWNIERVVARHQEELRQAKEEAKLAREIAESM